MFTIVLVQRLLLDLDFEQTEKLTITYGDDGLPLRDEEGNPIYQIVYEPDYQASYELKLTALLDENNQPVLDEETGEVIMVLELDQEGKSILVLDEENQPVIALNELGKPVRFYDENGDPVLAFDESNEPVVVINDATEKPYQVIDRDGKNVYTDTPVWVNVPQQLNSNSLVPELFDEQLHTTPRRNGPLELPATVGNIELIRTAGSITCAVDDEGVKCINEAKCTVANSSPSRPIEADELGKFWDCTGTEVFEMDFDFDNPVKDVRILGNTVCAFTVSATYCEVGDDSFVGAISGLE